MFSPLNFEVLYTVERRIQISLCTFLSHGNRMTASEVVGCCSRRPRVAEVARWLLHDHEARRYGPGLRARLCNAPALKQPCFIYRWTQNSVLATLLFRAWKSNGALWSYKHLKRRPRSLNFARGFRSAAVQITFASWFADCYRAISRIMSTSEDAEFSCRDARFYFVKIYARMTKLWLLECHRSLERCSAKSPGTLQRT